TLRTTSTAVAPTRLPSTASTRPALRSGSMAGSDNARRNATWPSSTPTTPTTAPARPRPTPARVPRVWRPASSPRPKSPCLLGSDGDLVAAIARAALAGLAFTRLELGQEPVDDAPLAGFVGERLTDDATGQLDGQRADLCT